jgi:hypothetical protein
MKLAVEARVDNRQVYATGSAAELVNAIGIDCPPRPVPWTIWVCFWLAFLALGVSGY